MGAGEESSRKRESELSFSAAEAVPRSATAYEGTTKKAYSWKQRHEYDSLKRDDRPPQQAFRDVGGASRDLAEAH